MKIASNHLINCFVCRLGLTMIALLLASAMAMTALAQSTDRDNPTPLTANEIADEFHQNDPELFYQFVAGPGTVNFTPRPARQKLRWRLYRDPFRLAAPRTGRL